MAAFTAATYRRTVRAATGPANGNSNWRIRFAATDQASAIRSTSLGRFVAPYEVAKRAGVTTGMAIVDARAAATIDAESRSR